MKVVLFELDLSGHRSVYLRRIIDACQGLDVDLRLVTVRDAPQVDTFQQLLAPVADRFELDDTLEPAPHKPLEAAFATVRGVRSAIRRHAPEHLYLPYGDGAMQVAALGGLPALHPRRCQIETVLHHSRQGYPQTNWRRRLGAAIPAAALRFRNPFACIHHVDLLEYETWRRRKLLPENIRFLPDPIDAPPPQDRSEARASLGIDPVGPWLGVVGQINARKGVEQAIAAFAQADLPASAKLLLAGSHNEPTLNFISQNFAPLVAAGRIVSINRFMPMQQVLAALAALDLVLVTHQHHIGISSIALRGAAAGRPVLGANTGWIEAVVPRFGMGWTCDVTSVAVLAQAMSKRLADAATWRPTQSAGRLLRFHALENFEAVIAAGLRERLGLPPDPRTLTWDWVESDSDSGSKTPAMSSPVG